jgi:hypothetical protein
MSMVAVKYVNIVFHSILHVFNFLFSGCIADRDFTPGVSVLDNIVEAIQSSCKVILVLTDHFVSSQWCECEANQANEILFYCHIGIGQMLQFNRYFTFFQKHWDDTVTIVILILNVV